MVAPAPRYQPYLDVPTSPFRWRLGLRPLDLRDWIQIDADHERELAEKARVMAEHPETAFVVLDGIEPEATEVLDELVAHLHRLDPTRPDPTRPESIDGHPADPTAALHPLDAAGRLVQEDLVLLVERDGQLVCGGGSVCFPNRWDLRSKVGRSMAEIHAPVAQLNATLDAPIDRFLERLTPDRSFWRLGWGVLDTDELYQAVDGTARPRPTGVAPPEHHLRVERETLRRFPETGCILFTIRTYLTPFSRLPAATDAARLADAIDALPADVAAYKQLDGVRPELVGWLRQLATTSAQ